MLRGHIIMKKTKTIQKKQELTIITDVLCNMCGESCLASEHKALPDEHPNRREFYGLIEKEISGGYSSTHLGDMTSYRFSLCEGCLRKVFDSFKIPVEVKTEYTPDYVPETELDKHLASYNEELDKLNQEYQRRQEQNLKKKKKKITTKKGKG